MILPAQGLDVEIDARDGGYLVAERTLKLLTLIRMIGNCLTPRQLVDALRNELTRKNRKRAG